MRHMLKKHFEWLRNFLSKNLANTHILLKHTIHFLYSYLNSPVSLFDKYLGLLNLVLKFIRLFEGELLIDKEF